MSLAKSAKKKQMPGRLGALGEKFNRHGPGYALFYRISHVLLLLLTCFAPQALAEERILSFFSDVTVHHDGSMIVTESITVKSEGNQIKRGIYRDFPTRYETSYGTVNVEFDVLSVERDGDGEPYHVEDRSNGKRVYIGEEDRILPSAEYRYTIRYYTDRQLGFFEGRDELYWNVTGNGWAFPIESAGARVALPDGITLRRNALEAYTGYQGDRGRDYRTHVDVDGAAVFETTRSLRPKEGLTIVASWPAGVIERPNRTQQARYFLRDYATALFAAGGTLLVLAYYLMTWLRVGRDPEAGVIIPRFEPPAGLSPAAVRYIRRMGYDSRSFASAVINMAVKGFLTINDDDGEYNLMRTPAADSSGLARGERRITDKLFDGRDTVVLKQGNHQSIRAAIKAHKHWLRDEYHKVYFNTNGWLLLPGIALSVLVLLVAGFGMSPQPAEFLFLSIWLTGWTFTIFMLIRQGQKFMAAVFALFEVGAVGAFIGMGSYELVAALLLLIALNVVFYYLIKAPTDAGRRLMDEIEGLKMYMAVAEKDRLNMLNPPEHTPRHFEELLPFALALGVDQEWAEQFSRHLARLGRDEAAYQPSWYRGRRWNDFNRAGFSSSLGASLSSAISASSTAPGSSSGSGGGGSSGGGGGGGGGGGW